MSSDWRKVQLRELVTLKRGYDLPKSERTHGRFPVLASNGITDYHSDYKVNGPGIVTGRSGTLGEVHYVEDDFWPLNTTLYGQDFNGNDVKFAYYYLKTLNLGSYNAGSSVPTLNRNHVHTLIISLPNVDEQKKISEMLWSLDEKIALNHNINKNLEEAAQAIFKHWFEDFEFPNENGEPYKSCGGEMNKCELEILIPAVWNVTTINNIVGVTDFVANGSFSSLKENVSYSDEIGHAILIRLVDYSRNFKGPFTYVNEKGYNYLKKSKLFGGEIIISNVGANAGTVFRAPKFDLPMTLGPNSIVLINNTYTNFMYYYLTSHNGQENISGIIGGSAQPKFNKTEFRSIKLVVPPERIIATFNSIIQPLIEKISIVQMENQKLECLRDVLLSKLMSGEIRVPMET